MKWRLASGGGRDGGNGKMGQRRMRHSPRVVEAAPDVLPLGITTDGNVVTEVLGECQVVDHSVQTILLDRIDAFDRSVAYQQSSSRLNSEQDMIASALKKYFETMGGLCSSNGPGPGATRLPQKKFIKKIYSRLRIVLIPATVVANPLQLLYCR